MKKERQQMQFTEHYFEKVNLVTITTTKGCYDIYKCSECGAIGKRLTMDNYIVADKFKPPCKEIETFYGKEIRIEQCTAVGIQFSNLKPGTIHKVIQAPNPYIDDNTGVWVMGLNEPVKVLNREFNLLK